jgi:copper transport protein
VSVRRTVTRLLVVATAVLVVALARAPCAFAHAALVKAEPADGAMIAAPPAALRLTFNEPVSPLAIRLFGPAGVPVAPIEIRAEDVTVMVALPALQRGTHLLSWRVISADGHPVGGSLVFSVGAPSAQPPAPGMSEPVVRLGLWVAKFLIYLGFFIGIGGAFFRAWVADSGSRVADAWILAALVAGLLAIPVSVGMQGLDVLDLPLAELKQRAAWEAGLATSYGLTAITAACALFAGLLSCAATVKRLARGFSLAGLIGLGLALALSGHGSNAPPQLVSRPAVFAHTLCLAFWVGALLPLLTTVRGSRAVESLARFSRAIPLPLMLLVASGTWLAVVQLGRLDALWTTSYGRVLLCKLALVLALLGLAAANRFWLVPRFYESGTARKLKIFLALELAIAVAILGLVATWRFTPPPRALAAADTVSIHLHGERAMADIAFTRQRPRGADVRVLVLDGAFRPLAAKDVTLLLANPTAGIEPLRANAAREEDNLWRIENLRIPLEGQWNLKVEIWINDFEKVTLDEVVTLPRMP